MKKLIALLLVLAMALSLAACGNKPAETPATDASAATEAPAASADPDATYTYNKAVQVFPTNWNPHTNQTNDDSTILDYVVAGLYRFDYNEDRTSYVLRPHAAAAEPEDVTAEYIGQYGLEEGAVNQAWLIKLNENVKWEDGTPITATDYVESYKRLLDPVAMNYRADGTYTGNMVIHNAQNYLYNGKTEYLDNGVNAAYTLADLTKNDDGTYSTPDGEACYVAVDMALDWTSGDTLKNYIENYGEQYFKLDRWEELAALADANGVAPLTDDTYAMLVDIITGNPAWGETEADAFNYLAYEKVFPEMSFDEVGVIAKSDYELVYVIDKPLDGFYLKYALTDSYVVKTDLYDSLAKVTDGVYSNTYGTSAETTVSFGPYKLTSFQADKQFVFERNENYFDLDGKYQATSVVTDYVPEAATRLELFQQGKLDVYSLGADDMETYSLSDYTYYATGDSTFAMAFNPGKAGLEEAQKNAGDNINKTILTLPTFRQAMSLAMDRKNFCLATSPTNTPAFGLFSTQIISDPDNGVTYRSTDVSKEVLAKFWGVSEDYGEGKLYADIDEAINSITGYNLAKAQEMFDIAYDEAIAQKLMDEDDVIEIKIGLPSATSKFYTNGYEYIVNNYTEAVKGTKLEGKLTFSKDDTIGNAFSDALKNNQVDMLFGVGWTGSAMDPFGLMEAYIMPNYQYDGAFDYTKIDLTINIDGVDYTAPVTDWYSVMMGEPTDLTAADGTVLEGYKCGYPEKDPETRLHILGAMEGAVLLNFNFIPLMDNSAAQLKGQQVEYGTEDYIFPIGFGDYEYITFNYTDAEWDEYVASNNNSLDYT
ncbi:MAG: ABC transporter substrate-binding protein [Eubacteriales bacterium]|nr:ABC transporter substrate-binding protein [Eubacteriales bacterium]